MRTLMLMAGLLGLASCSVPGQEPTSPALTHAVFFDLKQKDAASVDALIEGCHTYLAPHDGIVSFSVGPRHAEYQRDVNDVAFDVALTIVFEDTAAQEAYQITEPHQQFIAEFEANWERVRVFDSIASRPVR